MFKANNIFHYCDDSTHCSDVLYSIKGAFGNTMQIVAIKECNKHVLRYSNEWLYLINSDYYNEENPIAVYHHLADSLNSVIENKEINKINENVVSFITSFSLGTVHGYTGLFSIIFYYLDNKNRFDDYKIIVYKNSQNGILNIIEHLVNKGIINKDSIIFLEETIVYCFSSIFFIPNKHHYYNNQNNQDFIQRISDFIDNYVAIDIKDVEYVKSLNLPTDMEKILVIKGSNSFNLTGDGIFSNDNINSFKNNWNLTHIEPGQIDEIKLIHIIQQCNVFIVSWGTSYFKNYIYTSDKCKKIIVLIKSCDKCFVEQYIKYSSYDIWSLPRKYKNAEIIYKIVDAKLDEDFSELFRY
jgi:hypothetical protein